MLGDTHVKLSGLADIFFGRLLTTDSFPTMTVVFFLSHFSKFFPENLFYLVFKFNGIKLFLMSKQIGAIYYVVLGQNCYSVVYFVSVFKEPAFSILILSFVSLNFFSLSSCPNFIIVSF